MLADQLNQLAEAVVQQLGELLDTARPGSSQPLGKGREPGDIGKQDRRREPLALCLANGSCRSAKRRTTSAGT